MTIDAIVDYQQVLGELDAVINSVITDNILLIGDFNADPRKERLWQYLSDFTNDNDFIVADLALPCDSFTYFIPSHNTCSWIDHVLCSRTLKVLSVEFFFMI